MFTCIYVHINIGDYFGEVTMMTGSPYVSSMVASNNSILIAFTGAHYIYMYIYICMYTYVYICKYLCIYLCIYRMSLQW
jgi:hypothetical protein